MYIFFVCILNYVDSVTSLTRVNFRFDRSNHLRLDTSTDVYPVADLVREYEVN